MAHKTLIGGTSYTISGGKTLVGGTGYSISKGRTLVGGTGYDVSFGPPEPAYAMLYNDGNFVFQLGNNVASGKTLTASYTGIEDTSYSSYSAVTWNVYRPMVTTLVCNSKISPTSIAYWFYNMRNLTSKIGEFGMSKCTNMTNAYLLLREHDW